MVHYKASNGNSSRLPKTLPQKLLHMVILPHFHIRSVYFTENSGYRSLKNRNCVTLFGSCSATLTVGEPLGDVCGSTNHDFRTSVTGISGEIDASYHISKVYIVYPETRL